jgi:hypothetical protein
MSRRTSNGVGLTSIASLLLHRIDIHSIVSLFEGGGQPISGAAGVIPNKIEGGAPDLPTNAFFAARRTRLHEDEHLAHSAGVRW